MISFLPKHLSELQAQSLKQRVIESILFGLARILGFWKYPMIHDPELLNTLHNAYWAYKAVTPVIKGQKGKSLEKYFSVHREKPLNLVPKNFKKKTYLRLSSTGDLISGRGIEDSRNRFYEKVQDLIFSADISLSNLELTLTREAIRETIFSADEMPEINATLDQYNALKSHQNKNYTIFNLANNHILDAGWQGLKTTIDQLDQDGILYYGINKTKNNQKKTLIFEKNDFKIGFIGFTYSVNLREFPDGKDYLVNMIPFHNLKPDPDTSFLEAQIGYCKSQKCDLTIVTLHWGIEFELYPLQSQIDMAHYIAEYGADLIISHHTHVIQPYEYYQTKRDPDRIVPILYGQGNLSSILSVPHLVLSTIANFKIVKGMINGKKQCFIEDMEITPVFQIENQDNEESYICIEKLKEFSKKNIKDPELKSYVQKITDYATLACGEIYN